jgi:hypothetical protein
LRPVLAAGCYTLVICLSASIVHFLLTYAFPFFHRDITCRNSVALYGGQPDTLALRAAATTRPPLLR